VKRPSVCVWTQCAPNVAHVNETIFISRMSGHSRTSKCAPNVAHVNETIFISRMSMFITFICFIKKASKIMISHFTTQPFPSQHYTALIFDLSSLLLCVQVWFRSDHSTTGLGFEFNWNWFLFNSFTLYFVSSKRQL
jgi:hypothetical protein